MVFLETALQENGVRAEDQFNVTVHEQEQLSVIMVKLLISP